MLCDAVARAGRGLIDADLGGGLIKQRIARPGSGRSGGYRTLICFRAEGRAIFAFGSAKNDLDNIDDDDAANLKKAARLALAFSEDEIDRLVATGVLMEVMCAQEAAHRSDLSQRGRGGRPRNGGGVS